jgi:hypothetical protein
MIPDSQLAIGEICQDPSGLTVQVEDVDPYDYVHFRVMASETEDETTGQMSHLAFAQRFSRLS